jgi:hypothetical protein
MTTTKTDARIFLTDYASYNNGSQFEFGHWVDLSDFKDAEEFSEYISEHLKECDEQSPIDEYTKREELMFTDFEGFPDSLYGESLGGEDLQKIFDYIDLDLPDEDEIEEWISLHNEFCSEHRGGEGEIYENDDEFFDMFFTKPQDAVRASFYGDYRFMDTYVKFDGYANLESFDSYGLKQAIDQQEIINWKLESL